MPYIDSALIQKQIFLYNCLLLPVVLNASQFRRQFLDHACRLEFVANIISLCTLWPGTWRLHDLFCKVPSCHNLTHTQICRIADVQRALEDRAGKQPDYSIPHTKILCVSFLYHYTSFILSNGLLSNVVAQQIIW